MPDWKRGGRVRGCFSRPTRANFSTLAHFARPAPHRGEVLVGTNYIDRVAGIRIVRIRVIGRRRRGTHRGTRYYASRDSAATVAIRHSRHGSRRQRRSHCYRRELPHWCYPRELRHYPTDRELPRRLPSHGTKPLPPPPPPRNPPPPPRPPPRASTTFDPNNITMPRAEQIKANFFMTFSTSHLLFDRRRHPVRLGRWFYARRPHATVTCRNCFALIQP